MKNTWHNNRISKKLNEEYSHDFSLSDIDGVVRCNYKENGIFKTRFIIYESKNEKEKNMGSSQLKSLRTLDDSIQWENFDEYSGLFVLKIVDIDREIKWFNLQYEEIRTTTFSELYEIFSCKKK